MVSDEKKTVLLVDDDASLLLTLGDFLGYEGYNVVSADCGEQALKVLEHTTPDIIILDMSMPGMGGIGFLKEISTVEGKPKYPVLVLTARANMAEFFADVEVDGFVAKPCDPDDLLLEVSRILFLRCGEQQEPGPKREARKTKLLLGEDDAAISAVLVRACAEDGHVVDAVKKGPEVLERAIVERPDVVVVKLVLANMNGDAVAEMLHEMPHTRGIPIVLYDDSSADVSADRFTGAGNGIKRFVRGNSSAILLAAVRDVIEVD